MIAIYLSTPLVKAFIKPRRKGDTVADHAQIKPKWKHRVDSELTLKQILKAERDFAKERNLEMGTFHHFLEETKGKNNGN